MGKGHSHSKWGLSSFHQKTAIVDNPIGNNRLSDDNSITDHEIHFKREHHDKLRESSYPNKTEYHFQQPNLLFCDTSLFVHLKWWNLKRFCLSNLNMNYLFLIKCFYNCWTLCNFNCKAPNKSSS